MFYRGNKLLIEADAQAPLEMRFVQTDCFSELSKIINQTKRIEKKIWGKTHQAITSHTILRVKYKS